MSSWALKLLENVRTARDRCIEQLNGLARQVQGGFDDLRSRAWEFDLDTHPMDRIEAAMTWAEALVRRVILSRVVELRDIESPLCPSGISPMHGGVSPTQLFESEGKNPLPRVGEVLSANEAEGAEASTPFPDHYKTYSAPEPSTKYRPTFRWTEARSVPTVPKGKATGPRPKPRKYDLRTKIEAKLALYRHMLENRQAYAKRLACWLDTSTIVIPAGEPGPRREDDLSTQSASSSAGWNPSRALSKGARVENTAWTPDGSGVVGERCDVRAHSPETTSGVISERGEAVLNPLYLSEAHESKKQPSGTPRTKPPPTLSWTLYSNPLPGGDDLRADLVSMQMAYEGALSTLQAGRSSAETNE